MTESGFAAFVVLIIPNVRHSNLNKLVDMAFIVADFEPQIEDFDFGVVRKMLTTLKTTADFYLDSSRCSHHALFAARKEHWLSIRSAMHLPLFIIKQRGSGDCVSFENRQIVIVD